MRNGISLRKKQNNLRNGSVWLVKKMALSQDGGNNGN